MIEVLEPQNRLLKQFVDSIYLLRKGADTLEFTAYPTANTPVGLFRNTRLDLTAEGAIIAESGEPNHFAVACNQLSSGLHLRYLQGVDEIAINFKPLGFASFSQSKLGTEKVLCFTEWDRRLPGLFSHVFDDGSNGEQQLCSIETFLLEQYRPLRHEAILLKALQLLSDTATDYTMQGLAGLVGMHYKQLYREFIRHIGCSMAQYRNLVKFRSSLASKMADGSKTRLVDVCYDNGYTDQPHFIRQFKKLAGEKPARFFREATSFGGSKVIFRMD